MKINCIICKRPMDKVEHYFNGYPIGPSCAKNMAINKSIAIKQDQPDLFEDQNDQKKDVE